ncbi:uncharacterized protein LOC117653391 [Thrips palmi]|uniref:Uncharacterized protein LOC117653391 n=1 Tax=Thrips palmi TaxID=161013 RepID=A0A6P9AA24_THRPL|nr:uncharacterized protein LOC117653391 [Thrips palmi]
MDLEGDASEDGQDRDAQPHYPDLIDIVREQGPGPDAAGTGAPDADGDRDRGDRGHKASTPPTPYIDGVVPPRDLRLQHQREHPELVEDLKVFLGLKPPTTQTQQVLEVEPPAPNTLETAELADPSQTKLPEAVELVDASQAKPPQPALQTVELADPYHTKPPQPACAAEAMSAHDGQGGQGPGSEPEPQSAGDAPSSVLDCAALAAPVVALAVAGPSRHDRDAVDGDLRHGAHSATCTHGREDTSVEDKCLECCVYYGVMCCQCTIS